MTVVHVEYCNGGPVDGRRADLAVADAGECLRIYTPRIGMPIATPDRNDIASTIGVDTHLYCRTRRLTKTGYELYAYAGKEQR